jgi:hypothetical protein
MRESAPWVLPWKPPQKPTISYLPVWQRASRRALSTASAPPEYSCKRWSFFAGACAAVRSTSSTLASEVSDPTEARAACDCSASTTAGWPCPRALTPMPPMRSRKVLPSTSVMALPTARSTAMPAITA